MATPLFQPAVPLPVNAADIRVGQVYSVPVLGQARAINTVSGVQVLKYVENKAPLYDGTETKRKNGSSAGARVPGGQKVGTGPQTDWSQFTPERAKAVQEQNAKEAAANEEKAAATAQKMKAAFEASLKTEAGQNAVEGMEAAATVALGYRSGAKNVQDAYAAGSDALAQLGAGAFDVSKQSWEGVEFSDAEAWGKDFYSANQALVGAGASDAVMGLHGAFEAEVTKANGGVSRLQMAQKLASAKVFGAADEVAAAKGAQASAGSSGLLKLGLVALAAKFLLFS